MNLNQNDIMSKTEDVADQVKSLPRWFCQRHRYDTPSSQHKPIDGRLTVISPHVPYHPVSLLTSSSVIDRKYPSAQVDLHIAKQSKQTSVAFLSAIVVVVPLNLGNKLSPITTPPKFQNSKSEEFHMLLMTKSHPPSHPLPPHSRWCVAANMCCPQSLVSV